MTNKKTKTKYERTDDQIMDQLRLWSDGKTRLDVGFTWTSYAPPHSAVVTTVVHLM